MNTVLALPAICLALLLAACGPAAGAVQTEAPIDARITTSSGPSPERTAAPVPTAKDAVYYGSFTITDRITYAGVYALSPEEAEQIIGTQISYDAQSISWNGNVCELPEYQESTVTDEAFSEAYKDKLHFSDLGIEGTEIQAVSADNCLFFGWYFYVKDADTLLIAHEGAFFEAVRII